MSKTICTMYQCPSHQLVESSREGNPLYADIRRASVLPVFGITAESPVLGRSGMRHQGEIYGVPLEIINTK